MITRIFHPIGQGAFYTERVGDHTIVYDCGVWNRKADKVNGEKVVKAAFKDKEEIKILFISHFDYDHVSLVPFLLRNFDVKTIVMPLLENATKELVKSIFQSSEDDDDAEISQLVGDPDTFSERTGVAIVLVQLGEPQNENTETPNINIDDLGAGVQTIRSGSLITITQAKDRIDWVWVPFNFESHNRSVQLANEFKLNGIQLERITEAKYFEDNRKKIWTAYSKIDGNINENSLFLYSGPQLQSVTRYNCHYLDYYYRRSINRLPGCIFTGDGDLNIVSISKTFKHYMDKVGTIQIPHHGSKASFNDNDFKAGELICPVSVGDNNTYSHPSGYVLASLLQNRNRPIIVSERASSVLAQHWKCYQ